MLSRQILYCGEQLPILLLISFLAIIGMYSFVRLNVNIFIRISVIYSFITLGLFWLDFGKYGFKFTLIKRVKKIVIN